MATATEISTAALKRLRVVEAGGTPAAADIADANLALDRMIASWEAEGLSGDIAPFDSRFEAGIIAMLAARLSGDYGKKPDPYLMREAENGWTQLQAAFFAVPQSQFDVALSYTGGFSSVILIGEDNEPFSDWQAGTAYAGRVRVVHDRNLYELVTEGTSGLTGPTGTGSSITDGTCVWVWRGVVA